MKLKDLNPKKGDLVLIVRTNYVGLYQFETIRDGSPFGKTGFELKKSVKMGKMELPLFIPLPREDDLISIPLTANQIYLGFEDIISDLEVREGYKLHAFVMSYSRDRPTRKPSR